MAVINLGGRRQRPPRGTYRGMGDNPGDGRYGYMPPLSSDGGYDQPVRQPAFNPKDDVWSNPRKYFRTPQDFDAWGRKNAADYPRFQQAQQARQGYQSEQRQMITDLITAGYPQDVVVGAARSGQLKSFHAKHLAEQFKTPEDVAAKAQEARAKGWKEPPPSERPTGERYSEKVDPLTGQTKRNPIYLPDTDIQAYDEEANAFKGTTGEGEDWSMNRNRYGAAEDYRITTSPEKKAAMEQRAADKAQREEEHQASQKRTELDRQWNEANVKFKAFAGTSVDKHEQELREALIAERPQEDAPISDRYRKIAARLGEVRKLRESNRKKYYDLAKTYVANGGVEDRLPHTNTADPYGEFQSQEVPRNESVVPGLGQPGAPPEQMPALQTPEQSMHDQGLHPDGTPITNGFLGKLAMTDGSGKTATEITVGVPINGKETTIPSLVPTLNPEEKDYLLGGGDPRSNKQIMRKAVEHARIRIGKGLSPFPNPDESPVAQSAAPSVQSQGDRVPVIAPDGRIKMVPQDQINAALAAGGRLP